MKWVADPDGDLWLADREERVLRIASAEGTGAAIHPLHRTGSSPSATWAGPVDHPWHRGLWFAWRYINEADFWEWSDRPRGLVRQVERSTSSDGSTAEARFSLLWASDGSPAHLAEDRLLRFERRPTSNDLVIDWEQLFEARDGPIVLWSDDITEALPWGGLGGLAWRAGQDLTMFSATSSEGATTSTAITDTRARWVDVTGAVRDTGEEVGLTMFDHPGNGSLPTYWKCYAHEGFALVNAAPTLKGPVRLEAGENLRLRYRVLVHGRRPGRAALDHEYEDFSASPTPASPAPERTRP